MLVLLIAAATGAWADNAVLYTVGAEDNSDGYLSKSSNGLAIKDGQMATFEFTNYTKGEGLWQNWICRIQDTEDQNIALIRADLWENIAWNNDGFTSNNYQAMLEDATTFMAKMQGAKVVLQAIYYNGKIKIEATMTPTEGDPLVMVYEKAYTQAQAKISLTIENCHLNITKETIGKYIHTVSLKQETPDEGKWTAKAGEDDYQSLPLEGVTQGTQVSVKYSGLKKVKSVKAVKKVVAVAVAEGHELTAAVKGEIVGSDGKAYAASDKDILPDGVRAVALVAYMNGTNGLALAMQDEGWLQWNAAVETCNFRNTSMPITDATWQLPSKEQWETMFAAADSFTALLNSFSAVDGTNMHSAGFVGYWSATENPDPNYSATSAYGFMSNSDNPDWGIWDKSGDDAAALVRAALAW